MRYLSISVKMIVLKRDNKCWHGYGEKAIVHCWQKLVQTLRKRVWRFPKKLKTELLNDSVILLWGINPK